ncbi:MAG: hypothetical protein ACRECR_05125, partial [Thermoplasmata archaeon]
MVWDPAEGYDLVFSGAPLAYPDTWAWANGSWTNLTPELGMSPPGLFESLMAFDPGTGSVILWGDEGIHGYLAVTWSFGSGRWTN